MASAGPGVRAATDAAAPFGALVRRYRQAAALSQAALAERAGLSVDAISVIERGKRGAPRPETITLLAEALGLGGEERAAFIAAARAFDTEGVGAAPPVPGSDAGTGPAQPARVAADLPAGTLTFLFTDIADSTGHWERHPAAMRAAIARHDALMDAIIRRHGGRQVRERGEGDSIFAVFASAGAALGAACALQRAMLAEPWPAEAPLRVRVGLHSGEADPRDGSYYGLAVNRAARIRSLAHGGQVLASRGTCDLAREALPEGLELRPLGPHALAGLQRPEEIYQVLAPGLPAEFPPLASPLLPPSNLPAALSSFIGRERERGEVRALLGGARLVTLAGPGGMGKTRLALEVAGDMLAGYPDGVWLAELAPLAEPALLPGALARALGLREDSGRPALQILLERLQGKRLLLVLDNCEHLAADCAALASALLRACPHLSILATSREALGLPGEVAWPVPPLTLPEPPQAGRRLALGELLGCEAVQRLLARARDRRPGFALTERDAAAAVEVVRRLDGLPLAIELAASRLAALSLGQLAARLGDRFRLLAGGNRGALPRHQTLRAALDWSHDLLGEPERALLRRLSAFAGGWTLEAAEVVCAGGPVAAEDMLDLLGGLAAKSLVQVREREGHTRYELLETVRAYAWEQLEASGEAAGIARAHAGLYLALAEQAEPKLLGAEQGAWLDRLEAEHDNVRAALRWAVTNGEGEIGLRLGGALWQFWAARGHLGEGQGWLAELLAPDAPGVSPAVRALALSVAGCLAQMRSDYPHARAWHEEALALRRALGDLKGISSSLNNLGNVAFDQNDYPKARALAEESLAIKRESGDDWGIAAVLTNMANVLAAEGQLVQAQVAYEEALAKWRALGDRRTLAQPLSNLAEVLQWQGQLQAARALIDDALSLRREMADPWGIACSLVKLGGVLRQQGDLEQARTALAEALELFSTLGGSRDAAACLEAMAQVALAQGEHDRAARLLGAADALRARIGAAHLLPERAPHEETVSAVRQALGDDRLAAAWAAGAALSLEEAIAVALGEGDPAQIPMPAAPAPHGT